MVQGAFDQEHQYLSEVHFSLLEAELPHHLTNDLEAGDDYTGILLVHRHELDVELLSAHL